MAVNVSPPMAIKHCATVDEIMQKLMMELPDEIRDSNNYYDMAKAMSCKCYDDCHNHEEIAEDIWQLSLDEYTHAKCIRKILIDHCYMIPDDVEHMYQELKKRAESIYDPEIKERTRILSGHYIRRDTMFE